MRLGTAVVSKNVTLTCCDLINVTDNGNTVFCNDFDKESVFNVDPFVMADAQST